MALQIMNQFIDPETGTHLENPVLRVMDVHVQGYPYEKAVVKIGIWFDETELKNGAQPIFKYTKVDTGLAFTENWNGWWETQIDSSENDIINYTQNIIAQIFPEQPAYQDTNPIYEGSGLAPRVPLSIQTGTLEEAEACSEEGAFVELWQEVTNGWPSGPMWKHQEVDIDVPADPGFYWLDGIWRQWGVNADNHGYWIGEQNPCGGGPGGDNWANIQFELGPDPASIVVSVKNSENVAALHWIFKSPFEFVGGVFVSEYVPEDILAELGWTVSVWETEDEATGLPTQSITMAGWSEINALTPNDDFVPILTLYFTEEGEGEVQQWFDNNEGFIARQAMFAGDSVSIGAGMPDTSFNWALSGDDGEVLDESDVIPAITAIGQHGNVFALQEGWPQYCMDCLEDNAGGIGNIVAGVAMVMAGSPASETSLINNKCVLDF